MTQNKLIQLKIEKDSSIVKYIKIIRKFDCSLSVGVIEKQIEEGAFVVGLDLEYYDVVEDINGMEYDRRTLSGRSAYFYLSRGRIDNHRRF